MVASASRWAAISARSAAMSRGGRAGRGGVERGQLDRLADELGVADLLDVDPRDEAAELRIDVDQPLLGEQDQALADRGAADAELGGQIALRHGRAGREVERHDPLAQHAMHERARR